MEDHANGRGTVCLARQAIAASEWISDGPLLLSHRARFSARRVGGTAPGETAPPVQRDDGWMAGAKSSCPGIVERLPVRTTFRSALTLSRKGLNLAHDRDLSDDDTYGSETVQALCL